LYGRCNILLNSWLTVYNKAQLSLTHKQLKAGTANQRHPLSLAANLLSTI